MVDSNSSSPSKKARDMTAAEVSELMKKLYKMPHEILS